jgi:hypothetical protein
MAVFNGYEWRNMSDRNQQWFSRHPPVDGDSNDWMYGKHGILSYTIELGYNSFIPGEEELAGIVAQNLGANLLAFEVADNPRMDRLALAHEPLGNSSSSGPFEVSVKVSGGELVAGGLRLHYRVDGGEFEVVQMEPGSSAGEYVATIPTLDAPGRVEYYFVAQGRSQGTTFLPAYGPYEVYYFHAGGDAGTGGATAASVVAILILLAAGTAFIYRRRLRAFFPKLVPKVPSGGD